MANDVRPDWFAGRPAWIEWQFVPSELHPFCVVAVGPFRQVWSLNELRDLMAGVGCPLPEDRWEAQRGMELVVYELRDWFYGELWDAVRLPIAAFEREAERAPYLDGAMEGAPGWAS